MILVKILCDFKISLFVQFVLISVVFLAYLSQDDPVQLMGC